MIPATEMLKASITLANVVNGGPSEASMVLLVTDAFPSEASLYSIVANDTCNTYAFPSEASLHTFVND